MLAPKPIETPPRAMALVQGHFLTTLVAGTASIVNATTGHFGDIVRQTEQSIDNVERLIAPQNFTRHGLSGAGAALAVESDKLITWEDALNSRAQLAPGLDQISSFDPAAPTPPDARGDYPIAMPGRSQVL